jgi:hypothetical protein
MLKKRIEIVSAEVLERFEIETDFLSRVITGDESSVFGYAPWQQGAE